MTIRETHALELKSQFNRTNEGTYKLYKALASMANHGGTVVIGVGEDEKLKKATQITAIPLAGEVERIMQFAANLDPPLALTTPLVLSNPDDPTTGVIVVHVAASPMALS